MQVKYYGHLHMDSEKMRNTIMSENDIKKIKAFGI